MIDRGRRLAAQPTCSSCPYWVHHEGGENDEGGGLHTPFASAWPPTPGGEFCGEHPAFPAWLALKAQGLA